MRPRTASAPASKAARFSAIQFGATWLSASVVRITPSLSPPSSSQASAISIAVRRASPACADAGGNRASTTRTLSDQRLAELSSEALRSDRLQLLANTTMRTSVGGIDCPNRSRCWARARKQAGRRSSSSLTGIATTKPGRMGETSPDTGKGQGAQPLRRMGRLTSRVLSVGNGAPSGRERKNRSAAMKFLGATFCLGNTHGRPSSTRLKRAFGPCAGTTNGRIDCCHSGRMEF